MSDELSAMSVVTIVVFFAVCKVKIFAIHHPIAIASSLIIHQIALLNLGSISTSVFRCKCKSKALQIFLMK